MTSTLSPVPTWDGLAENEGHLQAAPSLSLRVNTFHTGQALP